MSNTLSNPAGFLTFTLHAHLPYVVNHGTWPHGIEWLHEAAAETYLPLLRMFRRLERDGLSLPCNLNLSPVLLEQLAHPVFQAEFPQYLERKILSAREDEAFFASMEEGGFAATARFWQQFFAEALRDFEALQGDIVSGFREYADRGRLEIMTCAATHGYMPLLGTDESLRAQVRTAVATHRRHLGRAPRGIWIPECGYRPAGPWSFPVQPDAEGRQQKIDRVGVEQVLAESGLEFFFVDTHLVEDRYPSASPYVRRGSTASVAAAAPASRQSHVYHPFFVAGASEDSSGVTAFARDPQTGLQVWSADFGYPGDENYLDFHKKRWPGGHRYWRVTGPHVGLGEKQPYDPEAAAARVREHARHFVELAKRTLEPSLADDMPPVLCSPFDAELFGHWWFEGPLWLEAVARAMSEADTGLALTTCTEYLDRYPVAGSLAISEGSWGAEGGNQVWLNSETEWTYARLYRAELQCRAICGLNRWRDGAIAERIVKQLCRELLLLESSDWQFLITTGAARDYAEQRFSTHLEQFDTLIGFWDQFSGAGSLSSDAESQLAHIEARDSLFAEVDPSFWAEGSRDVQLSPAGVVPDHGMQKIVVRPSVSAQDASQSEVPKFLPSEL